jgi:hypothetical protein
MEMSTFATVNADLTVANASPVKLGLQPLNQHYQSQITNKEVVIP